MLQEIEEEMRRKEERSQSGQSVETNNHRTPSWFLFVVFVDAVTQEACSTFFSMDRLQSLHPPPFSPLPLDQTLALFSSSPSAAVVFSYQDPGVGAATTTT
jgi:hypothetical protein